MNARDLELEFAGACGTLARLSALPARQRRAQGRIITAFEEAALSLLDAIRDQPLQRTWLPRLEGHGAGFRHPADAGAALASRGDPAAWLVSRPRHLLCRSLGHRLVRAALHALSRLNPPAA